MEGARLSLLPLNLDLEEGALLYLAARLLARHSDEPNPAIRSALVRLIAAMPETLSVHLERLVMELPTEADSDFAAIFRAVIYGWATRRDKRTMTDARHCKLKSSLSLSKGAALHMAHFFYCNGIPFVLQCDWAWEDLSGF